MAAELYIQENLRQQQQLSAMAAADSKLATIAQHQAGQVDQARQGLASTRAGLATLSLALIQASLTKYNQLPEELNESRAADNPIISAETAQAHDPNNAFATGYDSGSAIITGFAYAIMALCFLAATAVSTLLGLLIDHGRTNAKDIRKVIDDYYSTLNIKAKTVIAPSVPVSSGPALPRRVSSPSRRLRSACLNTT